MTVAQLRSTPTVMTQPGDDTKAEPNRSRATMSMVPPVQQATSNTSITLPLTMLTIWVPGASTP